MYVCMYVCIPFLVSNWQMYFSLAAHTMSWRASWIWSAKSVIESSTSWLRSGEKRKTAGPCSPSARLERRCSHHHHHHRHDLPIQYHNLSTEPLSHCDEPNVYVCMGVSIYVCVMVAVGSVLGVGAARNGAGERSGEFREPEILKLWYVSMYVYVNVCMNWL